MEHGCPASIVRAVIPVAATAALVGPVPAQVWPRRPRCKSICRNADDRPQRHTANDRPVIGSTVPWPVRPAGPGSETRSCIGAVRPRARVGTAGFAVPAVAPILHVGSRRSVDAASSDCCAGDLARRACRYRTRDEGCGQCRGRNCQSCHACHACLSLRGSPSHTMALRFGLRRSSKAQDRRFRNASISVKLRIVQFHGR